MAGLTTVLLPIPKVLPRDACTGQTHMQDPLTLSLLPAHLPERTQRAGEEAGEPVALMRRETHG